MSVGTGLTVSLGTVAGELDLSDWIAESAVGADLAGEDFSGTVADGDEDASGVVDGGVNHVEVGDGDGVDEGEVAGGLESEGAECPCGFGGRATGEEKFGGAAIAAGEETGGGHRGGEAEIGEGTGGVPASYVNACSGFGGAGADEDEGVFCGGCGGESRGCEGASSGYNERAARQGHALGHPLGVCDLR